MPTTNTPKLNLLRIQANWQFGDEAFNRFIDDADDKLVGVGHLGDKAHWSTWEESTDYTRGDVVRIQNCESHQYYQCIEGGTSGLSEPTNNVTGSILTDGTVKWMVMSLSEASTNGGSIKIWLSGNYYNRGDAVLYGTSLYRCKVDHQASTWGTDYIYWQEIFASIRLWKPNIYYFVDDSVVRAGLIYQCKIAHTSGLTFDSTEESNWEIIGGAGGAKLWESNKLYLDGQFVINDGILYRSKDKHTSGISFSGDLLHWEPVNSNIVEWNTDSYYPQGSLVQYGNVIYKSIVDHNSGLTNFEDDRVNWTMFHVPSAFIYDWTVNTYYYVGQFILYNDSLYVCNISHISDSVDFANDDTKWDIVYASLLQWVSNKYYKIGSVVIYDGNIYRCKVANIDIAFTASNWDKLTNVKINNWVSNKAYEQNEIVLHYGILYRATLNHISGNDFLTDSNKWELVYSSIPLWSANVDYKVGDIVINDGRIYRCKIDNNNSSFFGSNWDYLNPIESWEPNKYYPLHIFSVYDGKLYRCIVSHTSTSTFDDNKWESFSGGGGGSGVGYSQIGLQNIVASVSNPYIVDISIFSNSEHILPPIDVLKKMPGYSTSKTVMNFNLSDSNKFSYDSDCIKFDNGFMKINQLISVNLNAAEQLGDKYIRISDTIDLSKYKSVESVVCI